ncbi:MAG: polysaccharide deacetylase family protein [Acidimicrobiia bacterium]|nr:polysaccharide deacetylase family protein [Acidimicrobiia bacterium]
MDRAAFIISIDTEMAWGLVHRPDREYRYDSERPDLRRLLTLFDTYDIPATWAVVGHLMLDGCEAIDGVKHPEIVRPSYEWFDGDWFDEDPCSNLDDAPTWYAADLIDEIRSATTAHEIGSHGFSHMIIGDPGCSRETFASELRAAIAAADARGIALRSLIYPRNQIGHQDVLDEHGIIAYRGSRPRTPGTTLWQRLADRLVGSERTAVLPIPEGPRWNLPATIMFDVDSRRLSWRLWVRQVERRLEQAVARRSLFHLWFHPDNLRDNTEVAFAALERLCRAAAVHRDRSDLDVVTMGDLADQLTSATTRS